ncbi:MAG: ComEC family competence protein [Taibaiella sp.]|nr:ComEC family competence protein [Taibaiella sp.]
MKAKRDPVNLGHYPFLLPLLSMIAGILWYQLKPWGQSFQVITAGLGLALISALFLHLHSSSSRLIRKGRICSLLSIFILLGWVLSYYHDVRNQEKWMGTHLSEKSAFLVEIYEAPQPKTKIIKLPVRVIAAKMKNGWTGNHGIMDLNIYLREPVPSYKIGDRLIIPNELALIRSTGNPFAFDQAAYANIQGRYHHTFLAAEQTKLLPAGLESKNIWSQTKDRLLQAIYFNVEDSTTASLMAAVIINERTYLDKGLWEDYSRTGVAHIVAISGMHITLFFSILAAMLFLIKSRRWFWVKYLIIFPFIWSYIAITGFPPSAVRAGIMFSLLCLSVFVQREHMMVNSLFATAFIVLAVRPIWLFDVGFQLSFLSVLSIFIFYQPVASLWKVNSKVLSYLWSIAAVSISVQILLAPLLMYYFHQFSLWAVLTNLPAAVYSTVFMVLSLILLLLGSAGWDVKWLGDIITWITDLFHYIIQWFSGLSPDFLHHIFITRGEYVLLMTLVVLTAFFLFYRDKRWWWPIGMNAVLLLICLAGNTYAHVHQEYLIVYQSPGKSMTEYIRGRKAILMAPEERNAMEQKYILDPAHLGMGVKEVEARQPDHSLFFIGGKKVLVLHQCMDKGTGKVFPVDILVLSRPASQNLENTLQVFRPRQIILDSSHPRYLSRDIRELLVEKNIPCHSVSEHGAYIVSSAY